MKSILNISLLLLVCLSFSNTLSKEVIIDESGITLDLSGYAGRDGRNGGSCELGEDGSSGYSGEDAFIYFSNLLHLQNVNLDMSGGLGGSAGRNGSFYNCDDFPVYSRARDGQRGQYGHIFLILRSSQLEKEIKLNEVSLLNASGSSLTFSRHSWIQETGARELFHNESDIRDEYRLFDRTLYESVDVELAPSVLDMNLEGLSLSVKYDLNYNREPKLSLYKDNQKVAALIDFEFKNSKLIIKNIFFKEDIFSSKFLGSIGVGAETALSFKDPLFLSSMFENSFSFTLYRYHPFIDRYVIVGGASSKYLAVIQNEDIISVTIGGASVFKNEFSPGSKYKVKVSTYKSIGKNGLSSVMEQYFTIAE